MKTHYEDGLRSEVRMMARMPELGMLRRQLLAAQVLQDAEALADVLEAARIEGFMLPLRCEQEQPGRTGPDPIEPIDACRTAPWTTRGHWCLACRVQVLLERLTALDALVEGES